MPSKKTKRRNRQPQQGPARAVPTSVEIERTYDLVETYDFQLKDQTDSETILVARNLTALSQTDANPINKIYKEYKIVSFDFVLLSVQQKNPVASGEYNILADRFAVAICPAYQTKGTVSFDEVCRTPGRGIYGVTPFSTNIHLCKNTHPLHKIDSDGTQFGSNWILTNVTTTPFSAFHFGVKFFRSYSASTRNEEYATMICSLRARIKFRGLHG